MVAKDREQAHVAPLEMAVARCDQSESGATTRKRFGFLFEVAAWVADAQVATLGSVTSRTGDREYRAPLGLGPPRDVVGCGGTPGHVGTFGMTGPCGPMTGPCGPISQDDRITALEGEIQMLASTLGRKLLSHEAEPKFLPTVSPVPRDTPGDQWDGSRLSQLADRCGTLESENKDLLVENARLRRQVETLERKAR